MAMSLEDLLAKEGFKRRKEKTKPKLNLYESKPPFSTSTSFSATKPRDNFTTQAKTNSEFLNYKQTARASEMVYKPNNSLLKSGSKSMRRVKVEEVPALDEIAVKAVISILSGCAKRVVEDDDFRACLHQNCLNLIGVDQGQQNNQSKVIGNLEQAMEVVERAADRDGDAQAQGYLKKASLQLSVITGYDGSTVSACAHLYLSLIYAMQNKPGICAKHLLQVLSCAPFQARTLLLPHLWERLFLPHLVHLKLWFHNHTHSKLAENAYNQSLDNGTREFALYYKDWIMDGVEEPSVPLIQIPCLAVSSQSSPQSQSMVSKELYDQVFRHSNKTHQEEENAVGGTSSDSPATQDKQLISYTYDANAKETQLQLNPLQDSCSIPEDFICPLTGLLFKDPVTLETGQTFDREAITDHFNKGCMTCPVTRKELQYKAVPPTNIVLKRVVDQWKTDHIEDLLAAFSQVAAGNARGGDDSVIVRALGQVLSEEDRVIYGGRVVGCGGVEFLVKRLECGDVGEKSFIVSLLLCCIEGDGRCRNDVGRNVKLLNLVGLLRDKEVKLRRMAVLLLVELICLNRRSVAKCLVEGVGEEEMRNAMHDLSKHLQSCPLEETPLVALVILNLHLLVEVEPLHLTNISYKQEAIHALAVALRLSICHQQLENKCCTALLILGGFFSSSGKLITHDWVLKLAAFLKDDISANGIVSMEDCEEEEESAQARVRLSAWLVEDESGTFLDAICKCLSLGKSNLVKVCLTTVAWLSFSIASLRDDKGLLQTQALVALVSPLIRCLELGEVVEHKIVASLSLYNFTTIPECRRILVSKVGEEMEMGSCLDKLGMVTWTAKELHNLIHLEKKEST